MKAPRPSNNRRGDPLEKTIEGKVCRYAESKHGMYVRKFSSPTHKFVPDRIFLGDNGLVFFVEFKRKGRKLTVGQGREKAVIERKGTPVFVIDDVDKGKALIDEMAAQSKLRGMLS